MYIDKWFSFLETESWTSFGCRRKPGINLVFELREKCQHKTRNLSIVFIRMHMIEVIFSKIVFGQSGKRGNFQEFHTLYIDMEWKVFHFVAFLFLISSNILNWIDRSIRMLLFRFSSSSKSFSMPLLASHIPFFWFQNSNHTELWVPYSQRFVVRYWNERMSIEPETTDTTHNNVSFCYCLFSLSKCH